MTTTHRILVFAPTEQLASAVRDSFRDRGADLCIATVDDLTALRNALSDGSFDIVVTCRELLGHDAPGVLAACGIVPVVVVGVGAGSDLGQRLARAGVFALVRERDPEGLARAIEAASGTLRPQPLRQRTRTEAVPRDDAAWLALLETVIDMAGVWLCVVDTRGRVLLWNRAAEEITGYEREEVLGKGRVFSLISTDSEQRRQMQRSGEEVLHHVRRLDGETTVRTRTGQLRTVAWSARRLCDRRGRASGVLLVGTDVTEQRRIQHRTRQNDKMEAVSRLAGGVAHDLNDLLTEIMGHCDLAMRDHQADEVLCDRVEQVLGAARRGAPLAKRLLALSRDQVRSKRVMDLNEALGRMQERLGELAGHGIELELDLSAVPEPVEVDALQLEEAVLNLVTNACEAMPAGGRVTVSTGNMRLKDAYATYMGLRPGHYAILAVSDTGMGIHEDMHPLIFEPFFTTKPNRQGLGLATVYVMAARAGGTVHVSSEVGSGCVFKVYLPRVSGSLLDKQGEPAEAAEEERPAGILLVEDRKELLELMRVVLEREGYRVLPAENAQEALALADDHDESIDLLIADVVMPGMHGDWLAAELKSRRPDMKVLLTSGHLDHADVADVIAANGDEFMRKPFSASDLTVKTREMLRGLKAPSRPEQ